MNIDFSIGLHIVGFLAAHNQQPATSVAIAKSFGTSPVVLRRTLAKLNHAGLVETKRGAGGGSVLARAAAKINLREVYESVCSTQELFGRHPEGNGVVASILGSYINEFYKDAESTVLRHLETVTVADMDNIIRPQILSSLRC